MRKIKHPIVGIALAAAAIASCAPPAPEPASKAIADLAGRTAGATRRCIPIQQSQSLRIADSRTLLYGSGRTIWINRLADGCPGLDRTDVLVVEPMGSQYCRDDLLRTFDAVTRMPGPACRLGDFVPYSR